MKIAILGGSFDPPQLSHLLVSQQVLDFTNIDEVWLMPCFLHPFNKKNSPGEDRLAMCQLSIADFANKRIRISDFEIRLKNKSYTIETVKILKKTFKKEKFFWLVGTDNLADFKKWKNWQALLKEIKLLVFPRIDYPVKKLPKGFSLIKSKFLVSTNLSSEAIRERVKKGLSIKGMVTGGVEGYIKEHGLYKS